MIECFGEEKVTQNSGFFSNLSLKLASANALLLLLPTEQEGSAKIFQKSNAHSDFQNALNWTKQKSQHIGNFTDTDSSVFKDMFFTQPTFSSVFHDRDRGHSVSSTQITLFLKLENHSKNICSCAVCILKATLEISKVYIAFFPSLKQNFMYTHCSSKPAIF